MRSKFHKYGLVLSAECLALVFRLQILHNLSIYVLIQEHTGNDVLSIF
jgi:hypothetical protein